MKPVMPCCNMQGQNQVSSDQGYNNFKIPGAGRVARIKFLT